jgi:hypothetical protein
MGDANRRAAPRMQTGGLEAIYLFDNRVKNAQVLDLSVGGAMLAQRVGSAGGNDHRRDVFQRPTSGHSRLGAGCRARPQKPVYSTLFRGNAQRQPTTLTPPDRAAGAIPLAASAIQASVSLGFAS